MSTSSLPSYLPFEGLTTVPQYSATLHQPERRFSFHDLLSSRLEGDWVKYSKGKSVCLLLIVEQDADGLPMYGCGDSIEGLVDVTKSDHVHSVELKVSTIGAGKRLHLAGHNLTWSCRWKAGSV
jgi:hypothetical protein